MAIPSFLLLKVNNNISNVTKIRKIFGFNTENARPVRTALKSELLFEKRQKIAQNVVFWAIFAATKGTRTPSVTLTQSVRYSVAL